MTTDVRNAQEIGNLILLAIGFLTICLMLHGETLVKVPRYGGVAVRKAADEEWQLSDSDEFRKLSGETPDSVDSSHPDWNPPCLPEEAPDWDRSAADKSPSADEAAVVVADVSTREPLHNLWSSETQERDGKEEVGMKKGEIAAMLEKLKKIKKKKSDGADEKVDDGVTVEDGE